ncbi:hypothetical protein H4S08_000504 [Coemansia sp. RSA 1365]|nr:hypothetical protein H4S08_000504 [Coemansia sp. RSA 1365]
MPSCQHTRGSRRCVVLHTSTMTLVALLLLLLSPLASAKPVWNEVNKYAADGSLCPPQENAEEACPAICVYDLDNCPQSVSCPNNQELCHDGECHDECTDKINKANPCYCGWKTKHIPSAALQLVPCPVLANVTIDKLYHWKETEEIRDACASEARISNQDDYGTWGKTWPRKGTDGSGVRGVWSECPKEPQEMYTFREPMWISVFTIIFGYIAFLGIWFIFKKARELFISRRPRIPLSASSENQALDDKEAGAIYRSSEESAARNISDKHVPIAVTDKRDRGGISVNEMAASDGKADSELVGFSRSTGDDSNDLNGDDIRLSGYLNNIFGTAMTWLLLLLAMVWLCFLLVITADYYGAAPNTPKNGSCIYSYNDCTLNSQTFIVMWCLFVFMIVTVNVTRHRLRNFFRIKTLPEHGDYVCVEHKLTSQYLLGGQKDFLLERVQSVGSILKHLIGWDWQVTTCPVHTTATGRKYFSYQCTRFVFDESDGQFAPFSFDLGSKNSDFTSKADGLTKKESEARAELIGPNFIEVYVPNWFLAFVREVTSFIALYQSLALLLMFYNNYWQVGLVDMSIILLSFIFSMLVRTLSEKRLKRMAECDDRLMVRRDGEWIELSTRELVPGDVIRLASGMQMGCDCILISGNAIMDEASLTGEAQPIRKFPVRIDDSVFDPVANTSNQLFAGTIVSQAQPVSSSNGDFLANEYVLALVNRTGTASDKGKLVRKILFPQPISFIFDEQLKVVLLILICYALFLTAMAIYMYQGSPTATYFYANFSMLQALNPLLPAALIAGQSMAAHRLKKKEIFCVEPRRIMMAGKVQIFCFDKTGTLTKEGLEFYGAQMSRPFEDQTSAAFDKFNTDLASSDEIFHMGVASCHAVTDLNGQLIGNPVDIEQFQASQWKLDKEPKFLDKIVPPEGAGFSILHVARRFEFVRARASMSVVVQDERTGKLHVFVKGSFERIKATSKAGTVPDDYDATCSRLAREGCYVLSVAHKVLDVSLEELRTMSQEDIEAECNFIGLLVFKNMLKPDTTEAIGKLKNGSTRTVMITGDTALTGIFIARQCGMVPPETTVLLADIDKKSGDLFWVDVDSEETVSDIEPYLSVLGSDGFPTTELAFTGAAFRALDESNQIAPLLLNSRVFARMKPEDKMRCVQLHMDRAIVAMVGDGGNDAPSLRAAHVGLALSDGEASIVAPFSSSDRSINSCVELLIQSRAGLVTSFANYRALILYGTTMTMQKLISFYHADSMSANIWMVIDSLIATSMAIAVTLLPPAKKLAKSRPTARILGPEILASVLGVVAINWCFMACVWVWVYRQSFFRCNEFDSSDIDLMKWYLLGDNYEAAIMTYIVMFQFINNGFMVNYGYVHRRAWYFNPALLGVWAMLIIITSYSELGPPSRLSCTFRLNCGDPDTLVDLGFSRPSWYIEEYNSPIHHNVLPSYAKWTLWGYSIGNMVAGNLWQVVFVYGPVRNYLRKRFPLRRLKVKL